MGSLSVSLFLSPMLLLRYYQSRSYSTLPTSASLAPSVVSYSLDQFLRRRFSNLTLPVRLYHHLGSSGKLFDMYSYTLHTLLRRSTTLCTHTSRIQSLHTSDNLLVPSRKSYSFDHFVHAHVAYPVPSHVGQSSRPEPKKLFVRPLCARTRRVSSPFTRRTIFSSRAEKVIRSSIGGFVVFPDQRFNAVSKEKGTRG